LIRSESSIRSVCPMSRQICCFQKNSSWTRGSPSERQYSNFIEIGAQSANVRLAFKFFMKFRGCWSLPFFGSRKPIILSKKRRNIQMKVGIDPNGPTCVEAGKLAARAIEWRFHLRCWWSCWLAIASRSEHKKAAGGTRNGRLIRLTNGGRQAALDWTTRSALKVVSDIH